MPPTGDEHTHVPLLWRSGTRQDTWTSSSRRPCGLFARLTCGLLSTGPTPQCQPGCCTVCLLVAIYITNFNCLTKCTHVWRPPKNTRHTPGLMPSSRNVPTNLGAWGIQLATAWVWNLKFHSFSNLCCGQLDAQKPYRKFSEISGIFRGPPTNLYTLFKF